MIDSQSIENLKNRLDIVEVTGSYLDLKKSGANFKSVCPFHSEDTPSFVVSPSKQIYHCFGCGAGGDAIKFVMEHEKLTYPETIEKLASMFNIHLNYTKGSGEKKESRKIIENLNLFFQKKLDTLEDAKEYLLKRGIYESSIEKFEIGYAPSSFETTNFLKENLFSLEETKELGLVGVGENGKPYSRFIERIMFPIYAPNSKIVGFGGRTITNHPAKYINSPQTKIFNKSKLLYGYHLAKESILKKNSIIITEGYLDVIMLHQAGFTNTVATLGTALTKEHIPLIKRGDPDIILSYDGDSAGVAAALKAASMLSAISAKGGVVLFEGGADPADMVAQGKINELREFFRHPKPFIEFCLERIVKKYNLANPLEKEQALKEGTSYLFSLSKILQDEYRGYLSTLLKVDQNIVRIKNKKSQSIAHQKEDMAELTIIKTLLAKPDLVDMVLNAMDAKLLKNHQAEFELLVDNKTDSPSLRSILIREDIKEYDEDELRKQLSFLLSKYYNAELKKVAQKKEVSFEKKNFLMRKIREKLQKLKKGELVSYEAY